jgi:hypothetical protein
MVLRRIVMVVVVADPTRRDDADVADARMEDTFPVARIVVVVVIIVDRSVVRPRRCLRFASLSTANPQNKID